LASETDLDKKDYHDLVHRIGRETAKTFGITTDSFLLCPVDFNYGCQHGFFEQALVTEPDARTAALTICDPSLMRDKPEKSLFYCFHGVGHGVLMAKAYRLVPSLELCDSFPHEDMRRGCWQGVFMENVNGVMGGAAQERTFSDDDLLAPCSTLPEKYRWECYINHAGYLVPKTASVERATRECLREPGLSKRACLQSIGLMATNVSWQRGLTALRNGTFIQNAVDICVRFPEGYEEDCIEAGVDNLANFDRGDTARMLAFCENVPDQWRKTCYGTIGRAVRNELPTNADTKAACTSVPDAYYVVCIDAATR
ncbi:MAG: hypothetical protein AAB489_03035, partial [Patescibacteria group bacterium]